eukprot:14086154-Alexandrium_andersonii.AAC.1
MHRNWGVPGGKQPRRNQLLRKPMARWRFAQGGIKEPRQGAAACCFLAGATTATGHPPIGSLVR